MTTQVIVLGLNKSDTRISAVRLPGRLKRCPAISTVPPEQDYIPLFSEDGTELSQELWEGLTRVEGASFPDFRKELDEDCYTKLRNYSISRLGDIPGFKDSCMLYDVYQYTGDIFRVAFAFPGEKLPVLIIFPEHHSYLQCDSGSKLIGESRFSPTNVSQLNICATIYPQVSTVNSYACRIRSYNGSGWYNVSSYYERAMNHEKLKAVKAHERGPTKLRHLQLKRLQSIIKSKRPESIGDYTLEKDCLKYMTTTIKFPKCMKQRVAQTLLYTLRTEKRLPDLDNLTCALVLQNSGRTLTVNGVSICYEPRLNAALSTLHYINGYKISKDDVKETIKMILCHAESPESYDEVVKDISRISLKFRRLIKNGINVELSLPMTDSISTILNIKKPEGIRIPAVLGGHSGDLSGCSVKLKFPVRKNVGTKMQIKIRDRWRTVNKFSWVFTYLKNGHRHATMCLKNYGVDPDIAPLLGFVTTFDELLVPTDRLLPEGLSYGVKDFYSATRISTSYPVSVPSEVNRVQSAGYAYKRGVYIPPDAYRTGTHGATITEVCITYLKEFLASYWAKEAGTKLSSFYDQLVRSRKLLEDIMEEIGAEEIHDDDGWKFKVTSMSGNIYYVMEATARVYDARGNHICITSAGDTDIAGYDYIAMLLTVLQQDSNMADSIFTLRRYV